MHPDHSQQDETTLVRLAQRGDQQAFGELVCRYHQAVINIVYRMCADVHLAEDAAQTAFLHAWQRLPDFQPGSSLRNWLYRIAVNAALDMLRRQRTALDLDALTQADPAGDPEASLLRRERQRLVQQAVLALPPASRAVLVLREYEGLSYKEIAEMLEISPGTVMSRLNYARTALQARLAPVMEVA